MSEKTGRAFGRYKTKEEAKKRLRQIECFKHINKLKAQKSKVKSASQKSKAHL